MKRLSIGVTAFLLLLALFGCGQSQLFASAPCAPASILGRAPMARDIPTPNSAPSPTPTHEPELVDLSETLRAAAGQPISLWYLTDNLEISPGFAEYTGYDALKDISYSSPTHIAGYWRDYANGYCYETFFANDTTYVLITDAGAGDGFAQALQVDNGDWEMDSGEFTIEDINHDGYADLKLSRGGSRGGRYFYTALLWGPNAGCYYEERSFMDIPTPVWSDELGLYWGGSSYAMRESRSAFSYLDGRFVETHSLQIEDISWQHSDGFQRLCLVEDALLQGGLREVRRVEYEFPPPAFLDSPEALARYAAEDSAWSGWTALNMRRHFQFG